MPSLDDRARRERPLSYLNKPARQARMSRTRPHPAQVGPKTAQLTTTARDYPGCLEADAQPEVSGITLVDVFDKDT